MRPRLQPGPKRNQIPSSGWRARPHIWLKRAGVPSLDLLQPKIHARESHPRLPTPSGWKRCATLERWPRSVLPENDIIAEQIRPIEPRAEPKEIGRYPVTALAKPATHRCV